MITFEEFKKLELKIARIIDVKNHPNADRLYVVTIDLGGTTKQIVAGIKGSYEKTSLVGRQIVTVVNLEPAVLRGIESQAMLLAASDDKGISIISPDRDVKIGSVVK